VAFSIAWPGDDVDPRPEDDRARDRLAAFRGELYWCFTARADALFEVADAVLCAEGPVRTLAGLSMVPEHRRGHGALYDAVNAGRDVDRCWQAFLRRFDIEHTFRLFRQVLGWTAPKICDRPPLTGGPGSSSPATPSSGSSGPWPPTCAGPGNAPPRRAGSPPRGYGAGSGTSVRRPPVPQARRNPASPGPGGRQDRRTAGQPHVTTSASTAKRAPQTKRRLSAESPGLSADRARACPSPRGRQRQGGSCLEACRFF
jgi:hypothetical protein